LGGGESKDWKLVLTRVKCINALFLLTCKFRDGAPAAMAMLGYVIHELLILLRGPEPLSQLLLVAARMPPHFSAMQKLGA
jgi:hypothetical protein